MNIIHHLITEKPENVLQLIDLKGYSGIFSGNYVDFIKSKDLRFLVNIHAPWGFDMYEYTSAGTRLIIIDTLLGNERVEISEIRNIEITPLLVQTWI